MLVHDDFIPRRSLARATKTETKEKTAVIDRELADSIYARMTCHGWSPYHVARAEGLTLEAVMEHFFDADYRHLQKAVKVAYMNGRRSVLPQAAFPAALRRAA